MIYTVTFNPALDYIMHAEEIIIGETNRSTSEEIYIGGKGINVSLVLRELDTASTAFGFVAGFTGEEIIRSLSKRMVNCDFVRLPFGTTRINVKLKGGAETEINGRGPDIPANEYNSFLERIRGLSDGDTLILAGSIPGSLPDTVYADILEMLRDKKVNTVVDASGKLLLNVLCFKPFLVKPNTAELSEIFGTPIDTEEQIISYAQRLQSMGARNVLVSRAAEGAILLSEDGNIHKIKAAKGKAVNSVGAGDSMVAGFIAGYAKTKDYAYALKLGTACGAATAFSSDLAKKELIDEIFASL